MPTFVYLDTETTGLDPGLHEVWEIAYAVDDGPVLECAVGHVGASADPKALAMNGYHQRATPVASMRSMEFEATLRGLLSGASLVGANPAFDAAFLRARWGVAPWKYRMLDVEAYAMPALGLDEPKGLAFVAERLGVAAPDHSAAGDVSVLRECHRRLRERYAVGW